VVSSGSVQGSHTKPSRSVDERYQASKRRALVSIFVLLTFLALLRV